MKLGARIDALEAQALQGSAKWCRVLQWAGQTESDAVAAHEAQHGPLPTGEGVLRVIIRKSIAQPVCE